MFAIEIIGPLQGFLVKRAIILGFIILRNEIEMTAYLTSFV